MAKRLRVGVVFGGRSGEHEVSLAGAASVMAAIDTSRFEVLPIGIAKDGHWLVGGDPLRALGRAAAQLALAEGGADAQTKRELLERVAAVETSSALARMERSESLPAGLRESLDVVLVLLHGPQGEDGTIQGLLELAGVPYTGAGVLASAIGMDKVAMKDIFRAHGLPIAEHLVVKRHEWRRDPRPTEQMVASQIGFPCFVKPANLGSSVGISRVKAADDLAAAVELRRASRPPHPGRAGRAGTGSRGGGARQRRARRLGARRGLLRGRVVRLRDQVRRGPDDVQGACRALPRSHDAGARARREGVSGHRRRRHGARGFLRRAATGACWSTRSIPSPASRRPAPTRGCGKRRASPIPS